MSAPTEKIELSWNLIGALRGLLDREIAAVQKRGGYAEYLMQLIAIRNKLE